MAVDSGTARLMRRWAANGRTQGSRRGHRSATARECIVLALAALSTAPTSSIPRHACKPSRDPSAASTVPSAASMRLFLRGGSSNADAVWAAAVDAGRGRTYYYDVKTKEVAWALPPGATLQPPRTAGAGASASAGATAGGGGSGATASAAGAVESGTAAQPASGVGHAQQAPSTHATAGSANDKGTQTGGDSLVTVHAPPVVAEVDPGFDRKPAEQAPAPDSTAASNGQTSAAGAGNQCPAAAPGAVVPGGEVAAAPAQQQAVAQQTSSAPTDAASAGAASKRPHLSSNSPWKEVLDPASGRVYYFHTITKESVWTMPNLTQVDLTEVEEKTSEEMRDEVRQHELVSMAESRYNDTAEAKAQIDEARAHYKDVKSGIADVRSADADLRAEANAATFTVTKFFTRLKNTAGRDDEGEIFVFLAMHAHQRPRVFVRTAGMCLCPVASLQVCLF